MEAGGERHFIYSLPLQSDRWYVGITCSPPARLAEHRRGEGAEWTRLYPPTSGFARVKLASGDKVQARIEEDAEVKRLMRLHDDVMRILTIKVDAHSEGPSVQMQKRDDRGDRRERR